MFGGLCLHARRPARNVRVTILFPLAISIVTMQLPNETHMHIHFLRHATLVLHLNSLKILVDPMLSQAEAMDPVGNAANARRIPMVELPLADDALTALLASLDAVIVTHTHRDHWDERAAQLLRKDIPLFCQPEDIEKFQAAGFAAVQPIQSEFDWQGIHFTRTGGQHGTGDIGKRMAPVSGFVLQARGEPRLYIAGDSIWCSDVENALRDHQPQVTILNAGAAQFLVGDPITMTADDVVTVCKALPSMKVVAVHMETINHCLLTRAQLKERLEAEGLSGQVNVPQNGETVPL